MAAPPRAEDEPSEHEGSDGPDRRSLSAQYLKGMRDGLSGSPGDEPENGEPENGEPESDELPDLDEVFAALRANLEQIDLDEPITADLSAEPGPSVSEPAPTVDTAALHAERDSFLDDLQRVTAEFANYRRQADRRVEEAAERKLINLVEKILPALDALDSAVDQGALDVEPVRVVLLNALEKEGLERIQPLGEEFDPNLHDAVMREEGDGDVIEVVEVLRSGYGWRGQVVRAAMVKVRG